MAKVELRLRTFIPYKQVLFTTDGMGNDVYFGGDGRGQSGQQRLIVHHKVSCLIASQKKAAIIFIESEA